MGTATVPFSVDDGDSDDEDERSSKDSESKTNEDEDGTGEEERVLIRVEGDDEDEYDKVDVNNNVIFGMRDNEDDFKFSFNPDTSTKEVASTRLLLPLLDDE